MIEFSSSAQTTGFRARLFINEAAWLPGTGLTLHFNGQEIGANETWIDTMQMMARLCTETPTFTDDLLDPNRDATALFDILFNDRLASLGSSIRPYKTAAFDAYCLFVYRWGESTIILSALWGNTMNPAPSSPQKWVVPTSSFRQVLLPLCRINSYLFEQHGMETWNGRFGDTDFPPVDEPLSLICHDDTSRLSLDIKYVANFGVTDLALFLAGGRLPIYALFGDAVSDLEALVDGVFDVGPEHLDGLDPHQTPHRLRNYLQSEISSDLIDAMTRTAQPGYEHFTTQMYGWGEETVIVFMANPPASHLSTKVWVIPNDDFRLMLRCAIDLFEPHSQLFSDIGSGR